MIKLNKENEPQILLDNKASWTSELIALQIANSPVPKFLSTKYNNDEIKNALRTECLSKCMYCESKVEHIADLNIEHIKPKAKNKYPELTFEYTNLGLACTVCNRNKSDTYDADLPFVNPYLEDPSLHFNAVGAFIWAKPNNKRAKLTENEIELNRPGLLEARGERMKVIRDLIDSYHRETNQTLKNSIKKQILIEIDRDKVYSLCCNTFASSIL